MPANNLSNDVVDRRGFLTASLAVGAVAALGGEAGQVQAQQQLAEEKKPSILKLSSQEGRLPGGSVKQKVENLVKFGGVGLELWSGKLDTRIKDIQEAIAGTEVKISAVCHGYCALIDPDAAQRKKAVEDLKRVLAIAGELGSTGVVTVPAFNNHPQLPAREARAALLESLPELGEYALKCKTRVLLEPLNRGEAFFLRQLADGASICRDAKSAGAALMGDFYHMFIEETSDEGAFLSAGEHLHHVHLASRKRDLPGQDERSFVSGFRGLQRIGYQDYCSLECGCKGDPMVEIPKSFAFLKKQWEEARA